MRLQRQSNRQIITFNSQSALGVGGEARIYAVQQEPSLVAKVYHQPTDDRARKLAVMLVEPPVDPMAAQGHISIAWPVDLLLTDDGTRRVMGFLMPRVSGMRLIIDFYNPKTRRQQCPLFDYHYLHRTARNLAAAVRALHARGYVIGDVNESNILVTETALVTLVDTDSFQVRHPQNGGVYRCHVGKPEFTPPELQGKIFAHVDRAPEHDRFGLAVLIFQLLMEGMHPFAGRFTGQGDPPPYEERISKGHFPYSARRGVPYAPMPIAPPFDVLHPTLRQLFTLCFEDGHRSPQTRPEAQAWLNALNEAENALVICAANSQHHYGNHLNACPWCERTARLGGRDPFPSRQAVQSGQHLQPPLRKQAVQSGQHLRPARPAPPTPTPLPAAPTPALQPRRSRWLLIGLAIGLLAIALLIYPLTQMLRKQMETPPMRTEVLRYSLELESSSQRVSGHVPLAAGEGFRFHFTPRVAGYLYLLGHDEKNAPIAFLNKRQIAAGANFQFPDTWFDISGSENAAHFTVIFALEPLTALPFLNEAERPLTADEQRTLKAFRDRYAHTTPEQTAESADTSVTAQIKGDEPLIFDLVVQRPGDSFTENLNGVKLEMVNVPAGSFLMGSPANEQGHLLFEEPQHRVNVPAFAIGKYEVTQAQWQAVMGNNPSYFKGDDLPVKGVSWDDAQEFCRKLSQMTGKTYRLPSEAEWEYACRAGTTGAYAGDLASMAWYDGNSGGKTHPVGQKQPNAFGLYDMHGNVLEWCEDNWHNSYSGAPNDGGARMDVSATDPSRVNRGGYWSSSAVYCRSASRSYGVRDNRFDGVGFRLVRAGR